MMSPEQIDLMFSAKQRLELYAAKMQQACMPIHPDIQAAIDLLTEMKELTSYEVGKEMERNGLGRLSAFLGMDKPPTSSRREVQA